MADLRDLADEEIMQLVQRGDTRAFELVYDRQEMLPQPTFEIGESGVGAVAVPADLSEADAVLVTREPRGGSRAPSEAPLLRARL